LYAVDDVDDVHERRRADTRVRDRLVDQGCEGPEWRRFAERLGEYGYGVVMAWLRSGWMFTLCAEKGCRVREAPPRWEEDDLVSLTSDTVVAAIADFRRKALIEGRWRPDGGASLTSYFTTGCVLAFPNAYRKWLRELDRRAAETARLPGPGELAATAATAPDPGDVVIARLEVARGLAMIRDRRTRAVLVLDAFGYGIAETAELLNTTYGAVKGVLQRHRNNVNRAKPGGGGHV
jgi:DNA-directed RNA polymerase specialized sigma24 family protein